MTLKEKFGEIWVGRGTFEEDCEQIADEFAIEFAEWLVIQYNEDTIYSEYTTKELLEIYKKEKGL
jgi:hypothetical protein